MIGKELGAIAVAGVTAIGLVTPAAEMLSEGGAVKTALDDQFKAFGTVVEENAPEEELPVEEGQPEETQEERQEEPPENPVTPDTPVEEQTPAETGGKTPAGGDVKPGAHDATLVEQETERPPKDPKPYPGQVI